MAIKAHAPNPDILVPNPYYIRSNIMAKHQKNTKAGSHISKGLRTSCKGNVKQAPKELGGSTDNAIRNAFMSAKLTDNVRFSRMGNAIIKAAQAPVKRSADAIRGWSAKLSFRTFNALKDECGLS